MILVTGCLGFIGSNLCAALLGEEKVIGVDIFKNKKEIEERFPFVKNENFTLKNASILDEKEMEKIFSENDISKVVHLAAKSNPRSTGTAVQDYITVNVNGTINVLEQCSKHGIKQLIFISTSNVYGFANTPFSEEKTKAEPVSFYAITKRTGELLCHSYANKFKLPVTILRLSTVFGKNGRKGMAVEKFKRLILEGKEIPRFGNGKNKRDYVYIEDVVSAMRLALQKVFEFEVINIGSGKAVSLNELIGLIERETGKKATMKEVEESAGELPITLADISKAKKLLSWTPKTGIEEGIREVCKP